MTVRVVPVAQIAIFFDFVGKIKLTNDDQSVPSARLSLGTRKRSGLSNRSNKLEGLINTARVRTNRRPTSHYRLHWKGFVMRVGCAGGGGLGCAARIVICDGSGSSE